MSERRPAQTIGELDVHIGHIQLQMLEFRRAHEEMLRELKGLATKADIERLATKAELTFEVTSIRNEISALKDDVDRIKPANLLRQISAVLAALAAFGAVAAMVLTLGGWVAKVPQAEAPQYQAPAK